MPFAAPAPTTPRRHGGPDHPPRSGPPPVYVPCLRDWHTHHALVWVPLVIDCRRRAAMNIQGRSADDLLAEAQRLLRSGYEQRASHHAVLALAQHFIEEQPDDDGLVEGAGWAAITGAPRAANLREEVARARVVALDALNRPRTEDDTTRPMSLPELVAVAVEDLGGARTLLAEALGETYRRDLNVSANVELLCQDSLKRLSELQANAARATENARGVAQSSRNSVAEAEASAAAAVEEAHRDLDAATAHSAAREDLIAALKAALPDPAAAEDIEAEVAARHAST